MVYNIKYAVYTLKIYRYFIYLGINVILGAWVDRVKTGIPGFDDLIQGGIPKGFNVLLVGQPGAGKTIFGLQYLVNGAKQGENGIYVSLDSANEIVKAQGEMFGWDVEGLEREGKLSFLKIPLDKPKINLFDILEEEVKAAKAERLVFDSLADFAINIDQFVIPLSYSMFPTIKSEEEQALMQSDKTYRYEVMPTLGQDPQGRMFYKGNSEKRITYLVMNKLSKLGTTNIVITDEQKGSEHLTVDGVSDYVADGVVALTSLAVGDTISRNVEIKKMRMTNLDGGIKSYEINTGGINIK